MVQRAARRGCIQAEEPRARGGRGDRLGLDLLLADHGIGVADVDLVGLEPAVGAGRGHDHVLARLVDEDERDAALTVVAGHAADVDPRLLERAKRELLATEAAYETHRSTEPRGGDGLVCALATGDALELAVGDGLARARQSSAADDEVHVGRADDRDPGSGRHRPDARPRALPRRCRRPSW